MSPFKRIHTKIALDDTLLNIYTKNLESLLLKIKGNNITYRCRAS